MALSPKWRFARYVIWLNAVISRLDFAIISSIQLNTAVTDFQCQNLPT
jgi:hypothetical protein